MVLRAGFSLALLLLAPSVAGARGQDPCQRPLGPLFAPRGGEAVPANAPALVFMGPDGMYSKTDPSKFEVQLSKGGEFLPITLVREEGHPNQDTFLIRTASPLVPGMYALSFLDLNYPHCGRKMAPFQVIPAEPPALVGPGPVSTTLKVEAVCDVPGYTKLTVEATLTPPPSSFAPLETVTVKVGDRKKTGDYGTWTRYLQGIETLPFTTGCGQYVEDRGNPFLLPPDRYQVELTRHLAGADADPPAVTFDIDLTCPAPEVIAAAWAKCPALPAADASAPATGTPGSAKSGGCAVGGHAPPGPALLLLLVLLGRARAGGDGRRRTG